MTSLNPTRNEGTAVRHPCGRCGAERGYWCRTSYGSSTVTLHKSRWDKVAAARSLRIQHAKRLLEAAGGRP